MRSTIFGLSALAIAAATAAPAFAEDAPASDITVTGGATVVTDYRFRGLSQTDKKFAVQGTFTVAHSSGFYGTVWGSSIDDYIATTNGKSSDQEIDLILGYTKTFDAITVDGGVLYYYYPGSGGGTTDFFEPYLSVKGTFGPATVKVGAAYAPKQAGIGLTFFDGEDSTVFKKEDNLYLYGEVGGGLGDTGISLLGHLGYSKGRSFLTGGFKSYLDWNIGASYTWNHLTFGIQYVDTDAKKGDYFSGDGSNIAKAGVVGSIGVAF